MTTPEGLVVEALKRAVKAQGGIARKVHWEGRSGAPDWFVMLNGRHAFVECKSEKGTLTQQQMLEHNRMRTHGGCEVYVVRSVDDIDVVLGKLA